MTQQASNSYREEFISGAKHKFQATGWLLKPMTRRESSIKGDQAHFTLVGTGEATEKGRFDNVTPMNGSTEKKSVTLKPYFAGDYSAVTDLDRMTHNEKDTIQATAAKGLGRKADKLTTAAIAAATPGSTVGDYSTGMTLALALDACATLQAKIDTWDGQVYCACTARAFNQLLAYEQFSNSQWVGGDLSFTKVTQAKFWNGVNWFVAPDNYLPLASSDDRKLHMWHRDAVGVAVNEEMQNDISWIAEKACWFVNSWMDMGALVLETDGLLNIHIDNDSAMIPA